MAAYASTSGIVPAQLGFLALFNPSLGQTDETVDDQIVYYASVSTQSSSRRRRRARTRPTDGISQEERHERLRQIGLAQGMVNFGRGFSDGAAVDAIDTEKSRVIAHELEPGWWILASIDLNKVPLPPRLPTKTGEQQEERYEYSTREMKPAALLLRDLLRAHSIFLLHHGSSLSALFVRHRRVKFIALLSRYWDLFLSTWNVMLHGNPARDIFGGINVAASGELGVGVGEEDRGSGEREVLEGLVSRVEGLVDLVVSRFGSDDVESEPGKSNKTEVEPWLGSGKEPRAEDGAIFLGTGALSRKSLRDVTNWMEDLYTWGEHAYGVIESPTSTRRARGKKSSSKVVVPDDIQHPKDDAAVKATEPVEESVPSTSDVQDAQPKASEDEQSQAAQEPEAGRLDKMVSYLTLGYGSYWSFPGAGGNSSEAADQQQAAADGKPNATGVPDSRPKLLKRPSSMASGHYLIGLRGDIEDEEMAENDAEGALGSDDPDGDENNSRTVLRTLHVELESASATENRLDSAIVRDFEHPANPLTSSQEVGNMFPNYASHDANMAEKLRVVVYVNKPFIFTFLFRLRTDSLAWDTLYRSLHYQLSPLRKPLLASTKYRPERPDAGPVTSHIQDLVWDPPSLTVHSSIPNIPDFFPDPATASSPSPSPAWSRADAVSTHLHLLNIYAATRSRITNLERTQKTNRGWWIVWTRVLQRTAATPSTTHTATAALPLSTIHESASSSSLNSNSHASNHEEEEEEEAALEDKAPLSHRSSSPSTSSHSPPPIVDKEIFLIRRASDHIGFRIASDEGASGGGEGMGRLAQGIGVDTRRYIEELLTLL
ncbi:vacuolar fusion protein CCZ1 homolog [Trichoderma asperellum]|uniref:Vacuolar fusion protein CCZ1 homolog n=1 Tax=Trichoderma asperellum TaxID=101201 RepID=A0A6V8QX06_TRIAP|nr:vacuolar fusion protein CCZ1 homolog [Trichoderma asperellum]